MRRNVATALPALGEQGANVAHRLVPLLTDPCEEVRVAAAGSLIDMGRKAKGAVPALLKLKTSSLVDPAVIEEIIQKL